MIYTISSREGKGDFVSLDNSLHTTAYPLLSKIPQPVTRIISCLEEAGFEAWIVGGFVRDALRNVTPHDADIATNARWETVAELARYQGCAVYETGIKHGTVTVVCDNYPLEITTFRSEAPYKDHRHPSAVTFVSSITEDLARRDFTINAMAFHPERGLVDPYNGQKDLQDRIIRCVGSPLQRFEEDALRIVRALRFASQLSFSLAIDTENALFEKAPTLTQVAGERLSVELEGMLCGKNIRKVLVTYAEVLSPILPQLHKMKGFDQHNRWHIYDVLEHTACVVENTPAKPLVRWAALFHDAGKPDTFFRDKNGIGHMPGHPLASIDHLREAAKRFHFSRKKLHDLELLVRYHDDHPKPTRKDVCILFGKLEENDELFHVMCDLMRADALGQAPFSHKRVNTINEVEQIFNGMRDEGACLSAHDLPITGKDLIDLGVPAGPQVGLLLNEVFAAVANEKIEAERNALLTYAQKLIR